MFQKCLVCSSPREVQESVNLQLARGVRMVDIAKAVGVSKSSIGRHSLKCVPRITLEKYAKNFTRRRLLVTWKNVVLGEGQAAEAGKYPEVGRFYLWDGLVPIEKKDVKPDDGVFVVEYAPQLLTPEPERPPASVDSTPKDT
jgi:hypothetical protein